MQIVHLFLQVFGGLAIFIFGMKQMSSGLYNVAGQRMRSVLQLFASNRFVAVFSGALVTAAVQSSGAGTVMVIGFVNAGLLTLVQAVGIIFGTNIGTTVTAQLIAFNIGWLTMPLIMIGLILTFFRRQALRSWGETILGLGFLFYGMNLMADKLKFLRDYDAFLSIFRLFDCTPVNGFIPPGPLAGAILVGLFVTVMMQSSSACSGIVIALGAGGVIDLYTAIALILGSNIGSTVTAQLAAIPANRIAKQAALAHTLFNVIGAAILLLTLPIRYGGEPVFIRLIRWMSAEGDLPRQIANAHTVFNVLTTLILIPFIPPFAALCEKIIPIRQPKVKYQRLEPHLLNTPAIALSQTVAVLRRMLKKAVKMIDRSLNLYGDLEEDEEKCREKLARRELKVDEMQHDITSYLTQLMRKKLTRSQADAIPVLIHCTNDTERIGDHTEIILGILTRIRESGCTLSDSALSEVRRLQGMLGEQARNTIDLLSEMSPDMQKLALKQGRTLRDTCDFFESSHVRRLADGLCQPPAAVCYIELLAEFRKVSRHLTNVAERAGQFAEFNAVALLKRRLAEKHEVVPSDRKEAPSVSE